MDKVKQAAKDLRKLQKKVKMIRSKVAEATTKLQMPSKNQSMMRPTLDGLQTVILVKM